ncbi:hypothetical protein ACS0TY_028146 [Phlomoides rotata]
MAASLSERSSSSRSSSAATLMPGRVVIACDATRSICAHEFKHVIANIQMRENMIQEVDTITVLGVLHKVLHPMGFEMQIGRESFIGTRFRAIKEEVSRMVDTYAAILQPTAEECEGSGVVIEVKIVVGAPLKTVVVQEAVASNATWLVLNRHLKKELRFYLKHVPCKVAMTQDNLSLKVLRSYYNDKATAIREHELFYSLAKFVPLLPVEYNELSVVSQSSRGSLSSDRSLDSKSKSKEQSLFSPDEFGAYSEPEKSDLNSKVDGKSGDSVQKETSPELDSDASYPCVELQTRLYFKGFDYSEIQTATNDFSSDNFVGEDGYRVVYKGRLKDGRLIAVKVVKECSSEFHSQVGILSFLCHKNIVMLLGYSLSKLNVTILVYEYISNKSLEWHLFDNRDHVLEWHQRHAIAVGIAKGVRFLHEECRGCPIIHRSMSLSNVFLTREFVPLLDDCGLAKWNTNKHDRQTKIVDALEYLAPEFVEDGVYSVKTDVFAFGIILIQLVSGLKKVDSTGDWSLRQWAMPLIETLALEELVDPRLEDSYSTYELYLMAKVAYLCTQAKPSMRPTMGEVLLILEGKNKHPNIGTEKIIPHPSNVQNKD